MPVEGKTSLSKARGMARRHFIRSAGAALLAGAATATAIRTPAVAQRGPNRTLLKGGVVLSFDTGAVISTRPMC